MPLVSAGQQYEQPTGFTPQAQQVQGETHKKDSNAILWGVVIGLLLLAGGVGAYFTFGSSSPETPVTDSIPNDTIPYESPIQVEQNLHLLILWQQPRQSLSRRKKSKLKNSQKKTQIPLLYQDTMSNFNDTHNE